MQALGSGPELSMRERQTAKPSGFDGPARAASLARGLPNRLQPWPPGSPATAAGPRPGKAPSTAGAASAPPPEAAATSPSAQTAGSRRDSALRHQGAGGGAAPDSSLDIRTPPARSRRNGTVKPVRRQRDRPPDRTRPSNRREAGRNHP